MRQSARPASDCGCRVELHTSRGGATETRVRTRCRCGASSEPVLQQAFARRFVSTLYDGCRFVPVARDALQHSWPLWCCDQSGHSRAVGAAPEHRGDQGSDWLDGLRERDSPTLRHHAAFWRRLPHAFIRRVRKRGRRECCFEPHACACSSIVRRVPHQSLRRGAGDSSRTLPTREGALVARRQSGST